MAKTIEIQIDAFGNSHLDAKGFVGNSCATATAAYLAALSPEKKDDTKKPEYSMPNATGSTVGQGRW